MIRVFDLSPTTAQFLGLLVSTIGTIAVAYFQFRSATARSKRREEP